MKKRVAIIFGVELQAGSVDRVNSQSVERIEGALSGMTLALNIPFVDIFDHRRRHRCSGSMCESVFLYVRHHS